ncbi:MAG: DUF2232 domain-containing protein [Desulfobacteraceae bacterium]|nr:MAG: DUF2232 domain-containing protein [Desulfobacteraceae bacterium]
MSRGIDHTIALKDMVIGIFSCLLIFIVSISSPLLGMIAPVLLPFPVLYYRLKLGRTGGLIILSVCVGAILAYTGQLLGTGPGVHVIDITIVSAPLICGFFLGEFTENHMGIERLIGFTCLSTLGICTLFLVIHGGLNSKTVPVLISEYVTRNLDLITALLKQASLQTEEAAGGMNDMIHIISDQKHRMIRIFPATISFMLMNVIWINIMMIRKVLARKAIEVRSLNRIQDWKLPNSMVFMAIGFVLFSFIPVSGLDVISLNALLFILMLYLFQGMAIVSFLFKKKGMPLKLGVIFITAGIIIFQLLFVFLIMVLGIFDTWFDFRKLERFGNSPKQILP